MPYNKVCGRFRSIEGLASSSPQPEISIEDLLERLEENEDKVLILKHNEENFFKTSFGSEEDKRRSFLFTHQGLIAELEDEEEVYVDATYKLVENSPFCQLVVILARSMHSVSTIDNILFFHLTVL
jgi:hypothetical protein